MESICIRNEQDIKTQLKTIGENCDRALKISEKILGVPALPQNYSSDNFSF